MKKIMNNPSEIVEEMVQGFVATHDDLVRRVPETMAIARKDKEANKVALVSGGGSGHEPAHAGYIGKGMLNAAVCGQVFTSPTPDQIFEAIKAVDQKAGVLLVVKNYSGDVMNFDMAKDMADMEDIEVEMVVVDDDIAVEDSTFTQGKRGVAGTVLVHKILGAASEAGKNLQEVAELGKTIIPKIHTLGVALSGATVPEVGKPGFILPEDEVEFGVGIHGEPGYKREKLKPSKAMAEELVAKLKTAYQWNKGDEFAILVNGLGATPLMEQYVFMNDVLELLVADGLKIVFKKVGNFMTSLDMQGISLTMLPIEDQQWLTYLEAPAVTVGWNN